MTIPISKAMILPMDTPHPLREWLARQPSTTAGHPSLSAKKWAVEHGLSSSTVYNFVYYGRRVLTSDFILRIETATRGEVTGQQILDYLRQLERQDATGA